MSTTDLTSWFCSAIVRTNFHHFSICVLSRMKHPILVKVFAEYLLNRIIHPKMYHLHFADDNILNLWHYESEVCYNRLLSNSSFCLQVEVVGIITKAKCLSSYQELHLRSVTVGSIFWFFLRKTATAILKNNTFESPSGPVFWNHVLYTFTRIGSHSV